jgi:hypothetical protein
MPANQWHMAARSKFIAMVGAHRPPADFARFREVNAARLEQLKGQLRSWYILLDKEITKNAAGAA